MKDNPRSILCEFIKTYGKGIIDDPTRFRNLIKDYFQGEFKKEQKCLTDSIEEDIPALLLDKKQQLPYSLLSTQLIQRLTNMGYTSDLAQWTVDSWATALGVITQPQSLQDIPVTPAGLRESLRQPIADPDLTSEESSDTVLLSTHPLAAGFLYKYVMALTPVFVMIISLFIIGLLSTIFYGVSQGIPSYMTLFVPDIADMTSITVFLIAPIGLFAIVAAIGWSMRLSELWIATTLSLCLSALFSFMFANGSGVSIMSTQYILILTHWIAFLIQPFSVLAALIVIGWTEAFRRSIGYTITKEGVQIRGGVWRKQEHMIPHRQIARVVMEQDMIGGRFNYGTVIPVSITQWGEDLSILGIGVGAPKANEAAGIGYTKGREEGSRYPLDCLFGIPDPRNAQKILKEFMMQPA